VARARLFGLCRRLDDLRRGDLPPLWFGRLAPVGWVHNPNIVVIFGLGLLALGVFGASIMIGER
jgi:hypothetical protein